jgi:ribose 5-phosphate isomerase B
MKIAIGSDEKTSLTDFVIKEIKKKDYEIKLFGPLANKKEEYVVVSRKVAESVANKECEEGVLFCWTGTGASIVANKIPGIRAALCFDAESAKGARRWNHANVLVMSLRLTSETLAKEMLDAWFSTPYGKEDFDIRSVKKINEIERLYNK